MAFQEKPLGQAREDSSDSVTVYTLPASTTAVISTIDICNVTGSAATFSIFVHATGTTYTADTAIAFNAPLTANQSLTKNSFRALNTAGGTIGYNCTPDNAVTISLFGAEISDD